MDTFFQDLRYSFRSLFQSRRFTIVAVLAIALGIGANTAIFSVVNSVLLKPLPFADPDRLVLMWEKTDQMDLSVAYPDFRDWEAQNHTFERMAASRRDNFNLTGEGLPERLEVRMISSEFFRTLGVSLTTGRDFKAEDDRPGAEPVVILDYGFWQRRFGGRDLQGSRLTLNGQAFTVVGVAPRNLQYGSDVDIFLPLGLFGERFDSRGSHPGLYVIARLIPAASLESAASEMNGIMSALAEQYPDSNAGQRIHMDYLYENSIRDVRPTLLVLLASVAFVLLIACANVANLQLARSTRRQSDLAVRQALGASRLRILRQLLTESVLLSLLGGGFGLLLAWWGTEYLVSIVPGSVTRLDQVGLDFRVLAFTFLVSVSTGILFGLAPALQAWRIKPARSLRQFDRSMSRGRHPLHQALVIAEVAVALVLLIGAGLMIRTLIDLQNTPLGFNQDNLLTLQLSRSAEGQSSGEIQQFFERVLSQVRPLPGVQSAALSNGLPFSGASENSFRVSGRPAQPPGQQPVGVIYVVTPDYFPTLGIEVIQGRLFTKHDRAGQPLVLVIDEAFAREHFPSQNPLRQKISMGDPKAPEWEIIGVVRHVEHYGLTGSPPVQAQYYLPFAQAPDTFLPFLLRRLNLTVRTASSDPLLLADPVRSAIFEADPLQPVFDVHPMRELVSDSLAAQRFTVRLMGIFAGLALLLAVLGIYGVMAYSVALRTHEIGIRMALGAERFDISRMVISQGMVLSLAGILIGLPVSFWLSRVVISFLPDIRLNAPTFFVQAIFLLAVSALACYLPARNAMRVDPNSALRE